MALSPASASVFMWQPPGPAQALLTPRSLLVALETPFPLVAPWLPCFSLDPSPGHPHLCACCTPTPRGLTAWSAPEPGCSSSHGSGLRHVRVVFPVGSVERGSPSPCSCPRAHSDQGVPTSPKSQGAWLLRALTVWLGCRPTGGSRLGAQQPVHMEKDELPGTGAQGHLRKRAGGSTGLKPHWGERGARWALGSLLSGSRCDGQMGQGPCVHTPLSQSKLPQRSAGSRARLSTAVPTVGTPVNLVLFGFKH